MMYQRAVLIWCVVYKTHSIHCKKQWSKSRRFCKGSRLDSICSSCLHLSSARHAQSVRNTWFINLQKNASQKQIFQQKSYLVLTLLCTLMFWLMLCREGERKKIETTVSLAECILLKENYLVLKIELVTSWAESRDENGSVFSRFLNQEFGRKM